MTEKTYAFIVNNIVTNVAVFDDPSQDLLDFFAKENNVDLIVEANGNTAIGYGYNGVEFTPSSPYPSWIWNNNDKTWVAPVSKPVEGLWDWSESDLAWVVSDRGSAQP
jgi:hypothetical protein